MEDIKEVINRFLPIYREIKGKKDSLDSIPVPPPPFKDYDGIEYGFGCRFYNTAQDGKLSAPSGYGGNITISHGLSGCDVMGYKSVISAFNAALSYVYNQLDENPDYSFNTGCKEGILDICDENEKPVLNVYMVWGRERDLEFYYKELKLREQENRTQERYEAARAILESPQDDYEMEY